MRLRDSAKAADLHGHLPTTPIPGRRREDRLAAELLAELVDREIGQMDADDAHHRVGGVRRVERARGDMLCYVVGDGTTNCYRSRWRTGSFNALSLIEKASRGLMLADLVALIASLDIVAPEIDR